MGSNRQAIGNMKVVVLCSGGMDSVTALHWARRHHAVVAAVSFDYGSKHNPRELPFAAEHARPARGAPPDRPARFHGPAFRLAPARERRRHPRRPLRGRRTCGRRWCRSATPSCSSIAAGFAESAGAEGLVIAAHGGDHAIYPDCREEFMRAMGEAMRTGTYAGIAAAAAVHRAGQGADRRRRRPPRRGLCADLVLLQGRRSPLRPVRHLRRAPRGLPQGGAAGPDGLRLPTRCRRTQAEPVRGGRRRAMRLDSHADLGNLLLAPGRGRTERACRPSSSARAAATSAAPGATRPMLPGSPRARRATLDESSPRSRRPPRPARGAHRRRADDAPAIRELAAELKVLGYHITIETAATVAPEGIACDLASLSPKLLNSAPDRAKHAAWRGSTRRRAGSPEVVRAWLDALRLPVQVRRRAAGRRGGDRGDARVAGARHSAPQGAAHAGGRDRRKRCATAPPGSASSARRAATATRTGCRSSLRKQARDLSRVRPPAARRGGDGTDRASFPKNWQTCGPASRNSR